jgi:hypothetical protein
VTAAVRLSAEEAERRELAAVEAERAAFAAWERAYQAYEAARTEHVRALHRQR